jgi:death-on-curing protein
MKEPVWIEKEALLLLHNVGLSRFGGSEGLRDAGLLDSALACPQNVFHYTPKTDLAALAASYAFGLVKNHPFVDGNKRAGFLACNLFLELNGKRLEADIPEAITIVHALAEGTITEEQFASCLGQNIR